MKFFEHVYKDTYLCVLLHVSVWQLYHLENLVVFWWCTEIFDHSVEYIWVKILRLYMCYEKFNNNQSKHNFILQINQLKICKIKLCLDWVCWHFLLYCKCSGYASPLRQYTYSLVRIVEILNVKILVLIHQLKLNKGRLRTIMRLQIAFIEPSNLKSECGVL
jgi:hypothetical protein